MVCAFGPTELDCAVAAAKHGGHCRIGFENNWLLQDGTIAANNAALIQQANDALTQAGYPIATASETRQLLGIEQVDKK